LPFERSKRSHSRILENQELNQIPSMTNTDIATVSTAPTGPVAAKAVVGPAPLGEVTNGVRRTRTTFDEDGEVCSPANPFLRTQWRLEGVPTTRVSSTCALSPRNPCERFCGPSQYPQPLPNTSRKYRWVATEDPPSSALGWAQAAPCSLPAKCELPAPCTRELPSPHTTSCQTQAPRLAQR